MVDIFVEGRKLDVFEGLDFSFNYAIADVREPDKRTTEYTKTIKCPATQNNDELFGHIYDFNIANPHDSSLANINVNFNPSKKASVDVFHDGIRIMRGSVQLRRIVREKVGMVYEVVFIGQLVSIFSVLGDKMLGGNDSDGVYYIDFSDLNHQYTRANQENSWSTAIGEGYVYPMVDFGERIYYHPSGNRVYWVENFRPALYAKEIIDRIFDFAGFSYTSTFFESAFFKRLVTPLSQLVSGKDGRAIKGFRAEVTNQAINNDDQYPEAAMQIGNDSRMNNAISSAIICFNNDSTGLNFDNGTGAEGNYRPPLSPYPFNDGTGWQSLDSGAYAWHVVDETAGTYNIHARLQLEILEHMDASSSWDAFQLHLSTTSPDGQREETFRARAQIVRRRNFETTVLAETLIEQDMNNAGAASLIGVAFGHDISITVENYEALSGDLVYVRLAAPKYYGDFERVVGYQEELDYWVDGSDFYKFILKIDSGYWYNEHLGGVQLTENETVAFNENLPSVSMGDYLMSLVKMFNLYVLPNPDKDNNLIIETYNDFYTGGVTKDWSHKLDYSQNITLQPLALLTASEYRFTYTEDGDYYNDRYQSNHGHVHGRRVFDVDNDFIQNTHTTEIVFSPSPLVNDGGSNRLIPKIYDSDIEEGANPTDSNVRILYYGGQLSCNWWTHASRDVGASDNVHYDYPYAGHLTHPLNPAQDIHFGIPLELFYTENNNTGPISITNNNLFNTFHRKYLEEITDKDSKLLTGYFYLDPLDIHGLDFRDTVVIDNSLWRINKVENYNPFKEGLTKVELLKITTKAQKSGQKKSMNGSGPYDDEQYPVKKKTKTNKNNYPDFQGVVRGANNEVSPSANNFDINGDRNIIENGTDNIIIRGDNNTIREGVTNVTLINTNGVTIDSSNRTYINNIEQGGADVVEGGEDEVRGLFSEVPVFVIDGGEDEVNEQFSQTAIYIIEGNGNTGQ